MLAVTLGQNSVGNVRLVQGSHIVVKKLYEHDRCYIFQNADGRIVFAIPYEHDFTLIGTTDVDYSGDPGAVAITDGETDYLCAAVNRYFSRQVAPGDVVASFAGVRPLYDDGASEAKAATRDYVLDYDEAGGLAPVLNIYGGKITTFRRLAEEAMARLAGRFPSMSGPWTRNVPLPGGNFPVHGFEAEVERLRAACPVIEAEHARRQLRGVDVLKRIASGHAAETMALRLEGNLYPRSQSRSPRPPYDAYPVEYELVFTGGGSELAVDQTLQWPHFISRYRTVYSDDQEHELDLNRKRIVEPFEPPGAIDQQPVAELH